MGGGAWQWAERGRVARRAWKDGTLGWLADARGSAVSSPASAQLSPPAVLVHPRRWSPQPTSTQASSSSLQPRVAAASTRGVGLVCLFLTLALSGPTFPPALARAGCSHALCPPAVTPLSRRGQVRRRRRVGGGFGVAVCRPRHRQRRSARDGGVSGESEGGGGVGGAGLVWVSGGGQREGSG